MANQILKSILRGQEKGMKLSLPATIKFHNLESFEGYSLQNSHFTAASLMDGENEIIGYGESFNPEEAKSKALSEVLERYVFISTSKQGHRSTSSNGWACHLTPVESIESSIAELVEREVAVKSWRNGVPYLEVPEEFWPLEVLHWSNAHMDLEFGSLKILLSHVSGSCCITALLCNQFGNFVSGHASSLSMESAILSAVRECFRSARLAIRLHFFNDTKALHLGEIRRYAPGVHSVAYAYEQNGLDQMIFKTTAAPEINNLWARHQQVMQELLTTAHVEFYELAGRTVAFAELSQFQVMSWGPVTKSNFQKNNNPHIVG